MADRARTAAIIHDVLLTEWPGRFPAGQIEEAVSLGEDGLGLDSIEIVEILLACEERCGGRTTEALLASGPVSFGRVVDHFADA